MKPKLSTLPPGTVQVFIDGHRFEGAMKVAVDWPEGRDPWVSITTDPEDLSYLLPPVP